VRVFLGACLLALGGACGPRVRPDYPIPADEDDPRAHPSQVRSAETTSMPAPSPSPPAVASGSIPRAKLGAVLDAGPAAFLQAFALEPAFAGDRFEGWEIRATPSDSRYARADLGAGDVVTRVNGKVVQRPEEFQDVWESLRFAHELVVEYRRNGQPRELRFAITP
jgi:S1-C subfamily serine protease